ncbi:putative baseplate assembly protein [Streptomyces sp. HB2AG]|uniref:putative baseplate assembly protein n=1 Tax=Streptomyces sp. HB2AG TaxID=2983400 RepID=UPI0022AB006D|nr:putative baseplate assembly protein [Streptomyces sp. HB2AG]MCZ2523700.1 putative baseplate assembly protein [Streptomyces sp. HB2AG]
MTPLEVHNPPGRDVLAHRVGTHADFLSTMLARLSGPAHPALRGLTVRDPGDPAVALLDAWAVLADLTDFHSERIAAERYLRTATDPRSLELLGRLVGHRPRPGIAASTFLAYSLDHDPRSGEDPVVTVPAGARSTSVPGPGEEPQSFETAEDLRARWSWNEMAVRTRRPHQLTADRLHARRELFLSGTANNVRPGDRLLFVFSAEKSADPGQRVLLTVPHVRVDRALGTTAVGLPGPELPSLAALLEELQRWITPGGDAPNPRPQDSPVVSAFDEDVLGPLRADLDLLDTASELAARLAETVERTREAREIARDHEPVARWFAQLEAVLLGIAGQARQLEPPQPPEEPAEEGPQPAGGAGLHLALGIDRLVAGAPATAGTPAHGAGTGSGAGTGGGGQEPPVPFDPAVRGLGPLIAALRTAPARQPAGPRHLDRDPQRLYAPGSDLGPGLLTALDPRLRDGLYRAWSRIGLTAPLALHEMQAMRVTATPFGATAPLKPVHDDAGRVVRHDDWPLTGSKRIAVRIGYGRDGEKPRRADLSYTEAGSSVPYRRQVPPPGTSADFALGPGRVELTTHAPQEDPGEQDAPQEPQGPQDPQDPGRAGRPGGEQEKQEEGQGQGPLEWLGELIGGDEDEPPGPEAAPGPGQEAGVTVRLLPDLPERVLFFSEPAPDGTVRVTVGDGRGEPLEFRLAPGDEHPVGHGGLQVAVRRAGEGEEPAVEVVLTARLQPTSRNVIALDAVHDGIAPGSWVAVRRPRKGVSGEVPGDPALALLITRVDDVRVVSRADFGITGKVTELTLEEPWMDEHDTLLSHIRDTTVHARGETLALAEEPVDEDVHGNEIELAALHEGLTPGRWVVVTGERTDVPGTSGVPGTELAMVAAVRQGVDPALPGDTVHTTLVLAADLAFSYRRDTVKVLGNVVRATQGATRDEAIGSGDAARARQSFALWQAPLTWLAAGTPSGAASTLEVRVDGVLWHEVDSLAGRGPRERVYATGTTADGRTTVTFGDGVNGARLPTGHENVRARYRVGVGRQGDLPPGRITQAVTRPLGVSGVTNPLPATGAADPDGPGAARRNIPLAVGALDRLVSVSDHADFARARAGIGRAAAVRLFDGARESVHVTVAGVDDAPLADDSDTVRTLRAALAAHGDPAVPVHVAVRELVLLVVAARVAVRPDHSWDVVEPALRRALLERLGHAARELGQPAHLSEVLAAAHTVPGVDHVDVDAFTGIPGSLTPAGLERLARQLEEPRGTVPARPARWAQERYRIQDPEGETLTAVAARHGITVGELLRLNPGITGTRPLPRGRTVTVFRGIRPAQFVLLSPDLPDTLILEEATA